MFESLAGLSILLENPILGLLVFLLVGAGVLFVLSEGRLLEAAAGLFRAFLTIFTTPFEFLRDALVTVRSAKDEEKHYARTRIFMLFRYSRLQYLAILVVCILVLSAGVTASLVSLYPKAEMDAAHLYSEQIKSVKEQLKTSEQTLKDSVDPAKTQAAQKTRDASKLALEAQTRSLQEFLRSSQYSGDVINEINAARGEANAIQIANNLDSLLADCPYGWSWSGFTVETCESFKAFAADLSQRKIQEQKAADAFSAAETAATSFESAAANAKATQEGLKQQLESLKQARGGVSLFNPTVLGNKIVGAIGLLIGTLLSVVVIVWLGAILVDVFNWIILMMRALEKSQAATLNDKEQKDDTSAAA